MSFDISSYKHREEKPSKLQIVDQDGSPAFYYDLTPTQKVMIEAGEMTQEEAEEFKKPITLTFKPVNGQAFRRAAMERKFKEQITAQGLSDKIKKEIEESQEINVESIVDQSVSKACGDIEGGAKMISELVTDWDGFIDSESNQKVEYDPLLLESILSDVSNLVTYTEIIKSIDEKVGFFTE